MSSAFDITQWLEQNLFDALPTSVAVIDTDFNIVKANRNFEENYGPWRHRKCYEIYGQTNEIVCPQCKHGEVFADGQPRIFEYSSKDDEGRKICRLAKLFPVRDDAGIIRYIVETKTDISDVEQVRQKYRNLFEQVPCDILIINKEYQIVETNPRARAMFGAIEGSHCYNILKNRSTECFDCTAQRTFDDGMMHSGRSTVINKDGKKIELLVTTVPYGMKNGVFDLVLEMAVDITHTVELEEELKMTNAFMGSLIASSLFGIIAIDENDRITVLNESASQMLKIKEHDSIQVDDLANIFPSGFLEAVAVSSGPVSFPETKICNREGECFPANLTGIRLVSQNQRKGMAFWIYDISRIKKLESEKLEAERLAAVGKTVAGLAHGIKNVLTGLEGGEYMLTSGLQKADAARIQKGMEMLNRNTRRVSTFVKEFLNFSKGQEIETALCDPVEIAKEVINTYSVKIKLLGINLKTDFQENIGPAPLDAEGIHECLSNILGNAIDACRISENPELLQIIMRVAEKDHTIIYEVIDNGCGMDYEIKKKVFTTFFTTKGLGGTGLGLLMTKKIVQQHGGQIEFESILDHGTTFRITLRRDRLPKTGQFTIE